MLNLITAVEQADPAWLTGVLRAAGVLDRGQVEQLEVLPNPAFNSTVVHLRLTYSGEVDANAPRRLVLKLNQQGEGECEHLFYRLAGAEGAPPPFLARCYSTAYSAQTGHSHCLLEDVSDTHIPVPLTRSQMLALEGVPPEWCCRQVIEAMARFHAYWWQHPRLDGASELTRVRWWFRDEAHFERHLERRRDEFARFSQTCRAGLPPEIYNLYRQTLERLPGLWKPLQPRVATLQNLTLTNGDAYFNQFMCARDPAGQAIMVDFQDAAVNFGAFDLVYLMATFWTGAQRRQHGRELKLLEYYHTVLQAGGVGNYSRDDLLNDYRLMLAIILFVPVWDQTNGSSREYWWPKMQCLAAAFNDWDCHQLFSPQP